MDTTPEKRLRVLELASAGTPYRRIEQETGVNRGTVSKWVRADLAAFEAAQVLNAEDLDLGDLGDLVAGLGDDVLGRARALVIRQTVRMLHTVVVSAATPLRDRLQAADRLRSWVDATRVDDGVPPLPALPPTGPAPMPCGRCMGPCVDCDGARWAAWVDRVVWARSQPLATDRSAIRAGGTYVTDDDAAEWLEQGAADIAVGDRTPAADFAARFASAAGDAVATLLAEHAEAMARGDSRTMSAVQAAIAALLPAEYRDDPQPLVAEQAESDTARILREAESKRRR